jgi:phosphatidate cytidylyltransferase
MFALVSMIAIVKISDTGQYTFGRLLGRHKLAPQVSPGKTLEGALGGVACAIATAWFMFTWAAPRMAPAAALDLRPQTIVSYAVVLAIAGILGDLSESMIKRDAGVKDSSTWLPGFGGVLDVLDSLLGAAPVAFVFWVVVILGL